MQHVLILARFLLCFIYIEKAVQQIQPAYVRQDSSGCLAVPILGVDLSDTFFIVIQFELRKPVCTLTRFSPFVEVHDSYKARVSCGKDEALNRINVCFTTGVRLADGGKYFASTSTTSNNTLYVMAPPRKPVIQTQNMVISGTVHSFTCSSASTSTPAPGLPLAYTWSVNNANIRDPRIFLEGTGKQTLTLNRVQKQDSGTTLSCTVMEENGLSSEQSDQEILNVLYAPEIVIIPDKKVMVQVNDANVHLVCSIVNANPNTDLEFRWTKDDIQISTSQNYTVVSVQNSDQGTYTCTCSNTAGASAPASVIVDVLGFTETPSNTTFVLVTNGPMTSSSTTSYESTSTVYGNIDDGIEESTTNFVSTVSTLNESASAVDGYTGRFSYPLVFGSIFGSLGLFCIGIILFLIIARILQKKHKKLHGKSKTKPTYVMEELWRIDSHSYSPAPLELKREHEMETSGYESPVGEPVDYSMVYDEILEESLDPYLTTF